MVFAETRSYGDGLANKTLNLLTRETLDGTLKYFVNLLLELSSMHWELGGASFLAAALPRAFNQIGNSE